jgi:hypothetical protein
MWGYVGRHTGRVVLFSVALLAIVGGIAYATIPDSGGVYTACMVKNVGTIRLIDPSLSSTNVQSHCTSLETKITWSQVGPTGLQGPKGDAGAQGRQGDVGPAGPQGPKGDPGSVDTSNFYDKATSDDRYGAVLSGRINDLTTGGRVEVDYGAASGISTAALFSPGSVMTLSPDRDLVLRDFRVQLTAAPGSRSHRLFAVLVNGSATGSNSCLVVDTSTSCSIPGPMAVPAGSTLAILDDPRVSSPAAADALFGFRLTSS